MNTSTILTESAISQNTNIFKSPLQQIHSPVLDEAEVKLYIKRDDLLHPQFGGNKWRKLKYNLIHAKENRFDTLLTFGGAWSNHIYATAAAGKQFGFNTIGLIRGEQHTPLNTTLSFARDCGMQLNYIERDQYRNKSDPEFLNNLKQRYGDIYILPEGGSNTLAVKGCGEIVQEIILDFDKPFDTICCACGTGGTLAGIISAIETKANTEITEVIGFSALKNGKFLEQEVSNLLQEKNCKTNWHIETDYHFGGYATINNKLIDFMQGFEAKHQIKLDAVYTGKMFFGLFELIKKRYFTQGTTIIAVHSGGLQGNKGFNL